MRSSADRTLMQCFRSENFSISYYSQNYSDLKNAFGSDTKAYVDHYMKYGYQEKRTAASGTSGSGTVLDGVDYSKVFSAKYYLDKYPDLKTE